MSTELDTHLDTFANNRKKKEVQGITMYKKEFGDLVFGKTCLYDHSVEGSECE